MSGSLLFFSYNLNVLKLFDNELAIVMVVRLLNRWVIVKHSIKNLKLWSSDHMNQQFKNKQILLTSLPVGMPTHGDFEFK